MGSAWVVNGSIMALPPQKGGGLGLLSIFIMYQKLRVSLSCQLLITHNPVVCHTASMLIRRECTLTRILHKPMCVTRDVLQCDPGANKRTLACEEGEGSYHGERQHNNWSMLKARSTRASSCMSQRKNQLGFGPLQCSICHHKCSVSQ